ncbi:hypothetical protein M9Y10_015593 [Tritrichomonas musculus]|uniref:C2 domain-containing protein n=1 Tax=Tritrichomonas musculus TaxID=1915356 RepID=A0ABR2L2N3_9EUKA
MLHIRVVSAHNLPVPTKKVRKTKIYCFSYSSRRYFYDAFKSKEKTTDPKFDGEFDLDLFRAVDLSFTIFSSRLLSKDVFLGRVDIDLCKLLSEETGKKILGSPHSISEVSFPITSCDSQNATLLLAISYNPSVYKSIDFKDLSKPTIHFWATYNPPLEITDNDQIPVEIELFQASPNKDRKSGDLNVFFTNLNKYSNWESVGDSSNNHVFPSPAGVTQVHTFALSRISDCYEFFILNDNNYTGTVTLNFIEEKKDKTKRFSDGPYYEVDDKKDQIGTVKTVSLQIEPNKKFCVPIFMFYEKKTFSKKLEFYQFSALTFDKAKMANENDKTVEYSEILSSQFPFHSEIIQHARNTIPDLKDANFMRLNVLTNSEPISLARTIQDFNLPVQMRVRIYIGGSATNENQQQRHSNQPPEIDYWEPRFYVYDANNGSKCPAISSVLQSSPNKETGFPAGKSFMGFNAHTVINVDLNQIGVDKVVAFGIHCKTNLWLANPPGFFLITYFDGNQEMLMFRTPFYVDRTDVKSALCLRFECQNDDWKIVPMRRYFKDDKQMESMIDTLHANRWETPDILLGKSNGIIASDDSDSD